MSLTDTQFRLTKSRAKQRLSRMGHQHRNYPNMGPEAAMCAA